MLTALNTRRAPAFCVFAEHRGTRGFTSAELARASGGRATLTEVATWIDMSLESGTLVEGRAAGAERRYFAAKV